MKHVLTIAFCMAMLTTQAQDNPFIADWTGMIQYQSGQVISLAEEMPNDVFEWAPSDKVRNSAGVFLHIAAANYFFSSMLGGTLPEGVNPQSLETDISGKDNVLSTLKTSYKTLLATAKDMDEASLNEKVAFPDGSERSKRTLLLIALGHTTEHKGQAVAYGRMNDVVPPWSQPAEEK